jgi:hypothetical protein
MRGGLAFTVWKAVSDCVDAWSESICENIYNASKQGVSQFAEQISILLVESATTGCNGHRLAMLTIPCFHVIS